ncbi:MAG: DNA cytosine methyltransferase [Proteobacteria bacterium]|nr:DNA cytosine methyltransferase [Pseudomonadota bacterium]
MNYYNDNDPYAAAWLRNLIAAGLLAQGDVIERGIEDVRPEELAVYRQCHFFAGIGGWPYALRLAGWPDDRPVWTGSCPCQPFSIAGNRRGTGDSRHLWPVWFRLIGECRPPVIFGEQVDAAIRLGWLDAVSADLEGCGYAVGATVLPAAGVGAPHLRHRLFFVAYAKSERCERIAHPEPAGIPGAASVEGEPIERPGAHCASLGCMGHADCARLEGYREGVAAEGRREAKGRPAAETGNSCVLADTAGTRCPSGEAAAPKRRQEEAGGLWELSQGSMRCPIPDLRKTAGLENRTGCPGEVDSPWRDADWLRCRDGKWRPVEPGTFPLAHGVSARMGRLRSYGNALVPQVAAQFIRAFLNKRAAP